jgi:hypothetical protein
VIGDQDESLARERLGERPMKNLSPSFFFGKTRETASDQIGPSRQARPVTRRIDP